MQSAFSVFAPPSALAAVGNVDHWEEASQYDTFISFFLMMPSAAAFSRECDSFAPAISAERSIWSAFESGSSSGFDLSFFMNQPEDDWSGAQLVRELRQLSGLTWQQAADLVGVKPRTLHNWATGHVIAEKNRRRLGDLLAVLRHIDQGYGEANRDLLLHTSIEGRTVFALLECGEFELVKVQVGRGVGRAKPAVALPQSTVDGWGPQHFGIALSASLHDPGDEIVPVTSTGKRPAKARRKG